MQDRIVKIEHIILGVKIPVFDVETRPSNTI